MLTAEEARRHDNIFINELAATMEDKAAGIDGHSDKWKAVRKDLDWFMKNNAKVDKLPDRTGPPALLALKK